MLLAGLFAEGRTTVIEPVPSRDHTERMLRAAGVDVRRDGLAVSVGQQDELELETVHVPGDPSSAAFHVAAAVLVPGSRIVLTGHAANWTRDGLPAHRRAHGRGRGRRARAAAASTARPPTSR